MNKEEILSKVTDKAIQINNGNPKRIQHLLKVTAFADIIAQDEGLSEFERFILTLSALLHDIGIKQCEELYNSTAGHLQELEGPTIAGEILEEVKAPEDVIDRVCFLISKHHTVKDVEGIDWQILLEADFLVNAFEDQLDKKQINTYKEKVFKTNKGIELLEAMYK